MKIVSVILGNHGELFGITGNDDVLYQWNFDAGCWQAVKPANPIVAAAI